MLKVNLAPLIGSLNRFCTHALEEASSLCISQYESEVKVSHLLYKLAENQQSDLRVILRKATLDNETFKQKLTDSFYVNNDSTEQSPSFSPLLIELLQEAWLLGSLEFSENKIRSGAIVLALLMNPGRYLDLDVGKFLNDINRESLRKGFHKVLESSGEVVKSTDSHVAGSVVVQDGETPLDKFGTDFTRLARENKIDPVLCRDAEIDLMIDILSRRRKNNPIAVGDAGVGKSALVEGLALRINAKTVPEQLKNVALWGLDLGALQAGASVKGEFEKRLKSVIEQVKNSATPIILFIDEAHTLIGAGGQAGGGDAANLLKPALARGELRTIAATTWSEYKKYFEKDPALSRRFQLVKLDEPTIDQAIHILRGLRPIYEKAHKVYISDQALKASVIMSERYISGRKLPDKAIDVLDTACARVSIALDTPPRQLDSLNNQIHQINAESDLLKRDHQIGGKIDEKRMSELDTQLTKIQQQKVDIEVAWKEQKELIDKLVKARSTVLEQQSTENKAEQKIEKSVNEVKCTSSEQDNQIETVEMHELIKQLEVLQQNQTLIHADVDKNQVAAIISDWTGVPLNTITGSELDRLTRLPEYLGKNIKGQVKALKHIHKHLLTAMADLRREGRPMGSFLLVGPSGVGKTETALQIADFLFGGRQFMTAINMSEYQEKHTLSRLIGSPPGYVGFGEGGILSEAIRQRPYSVVLLDEVEKAHPDVLNLFYQAFDKGEFADGEGRIIDCKNIVFFLTSNIGFDRIDIDFENLSDDLLRNELMNFFKPALLARMQTVRFLHLSDDTLDEIIESRLQKLGIQFIERYGVELEIDKAINKALKTRCVYKENGARMLDSSIEGELLPPLSLAVLQQMAVNKPIKRAQLKINNEEFVAIVD
ncbi:MAG: type VI secretion system ATPase TssH [Methylococcaceae bacterium]